MFLLFVSDFFFFNDTATTEIYTLSYTTLFRSGLQCGFCTPGMIMAAVDIVNRKGNDLEDRKSTRLNSSHLGISYAVFCLKKKKKNDKMNSENKHSNNKSVTIIITKSSIHDIDS